MIGKTRQHIQIPTTQPLDNNNNSIELVEQQLARLGCRFRVPSNDYDHEEEEEEEEEIEDKPNRNGNLPDVSDMFSQPSGVEDESNPSIFDDDNKDDEDKVTDSWNLFYGTSICRYTFLVSALMVAAVLVVYVVTLVTRGTKWLSGPILHRDRNHSTSAAVAVDQEESTASQLSRFDQLVDLVVNQEGWSETTDMEKRQGPQWDACVWLAEFDRRSLDFLEEEKEEEKEEKEEKKQSNINHSTLLRTSAARLELKERYAVAVLYFALNGRNWNYDLFWLSDTHVCEWGTHVRNANAENIRRGIGCLVPPAAVPDPSKNNATNHSTIRQIVLPNMGLQGTIPTEIRLLQDLVILDLNQNQIQGEFPLGVRTLPSLQILTLHTNLLVRSLPDWIGEMKSLKILHLARNAMTGTIPSSITHLANTLEQLTLCDNHFVSSSGTSDLMILRNLKSLRLLLASNIGLTGNLSNYGLWTEDVWSQLTVLDLGRNNLVGTLPQNLFDHPSLAVLDLSHNLLDGSIPDIASDRSPISPLQYLSVQGNNLTGTFPQSWISYRAKKLYHLDISSNALTGPFPTQLPHTRLQYIDLSFNAFDPGPVPDSFLVASNSSYFESASHSSLRHLAMQRTNRLGAMTKLFSIEEKGENYVSQIWWTSLKALDLGDNHFSGTLPEGLAMATEMSQIILYRNQLTGDFADIMAHFHQLKTLVVQENSWTTGMQVAFLCHPNLEEFIMDHCVRQKKNMRGNVRDATNENTNAHGASTSYCPCCQCCVAVPDGTNSSSLCAQTVATHHLTTMDGVWDTAYVRQHFRFHGNDLTVVVATTSAESTTNKNAEKDSDGGGIGN